MGTPNYSKLTGSPRATGNPSSKRAKQPFKHASPTVGSMETRVPIPIPRPYQLPKRKEKAANPKPRVTPPEVEAAREAWMEIQLQERNKSMSSHPRAVRESSSSSDDSSGIPAAIPSQSPQHKGSAKRFASLSDSEPVAKRRQSRTFQKTTYSSIEVDPSDGDYVAYDEEASDTDERSTREGFPDDSGDQQLDAGRGGSSRSVVTTNDGTRIPQFNTTLDGRLYYMFPDPDGKFTVAKGAIFPSRYQLHEDPVYRYICPVRSCRHLFRNLENLRGHFGGKHCREHLNDCCDGTLTVTGNYKNLLGTSPAFVSSRQAISLEEAPLAAPFNRNWQDKSGTKHKDDRLSDLAPFVGTLPRSVLAKVRARTPIISPVPIPLPHGQLRQPAESPSEVEAYLLSFLQRPQRQHDRPEIQWLKKQPKLRDIPPSWVQHHKDDDLGARHYGIILAYLVGDAVSEQDRCTRTSPQIKSYRLSDPCVALPAGMPSDLRTMFSKDASCIGCKYVSFVTRQKNVCDWSPGGKTASELGNVDVAQVDKATAVDIVQAEVTTQIQTNTERSVTGRSVQEQHHKLAMVPEPRSQPQDPLRVENWEMSPGVIKNSETGEVAILSGVCLRAPHATEISPNVSIQNLVLPWGQSQVWSAESTTLRTCSIGAGKLTVKLNDQDPVELGPTGWFCIRPGERYRVENRYYTDVSIHCTTFTNYTLREA